MLDIFKKWDVNYSIISKNSVFTNGYFLTSKNLTNAIYLNYKWSRQYSFGGFASVEEENVSSNNHIRNPTLPKLGLTTALQF